MRILKVRNGNILSSICLFILKGILCKYICIDNYKIHFCDIRRCNSNCKYCISNLIK